MSTVVLSFTERTREKAQDGRILNLIHIGHS
jgi:hypothetical protein